MAVPTPTYIVMIIRKRSDALVPKYCNETFKNMPKTVSVRCAGRAARKNRRQMRSIDNVENTAVEICAEKAPFGVGALHGLIRQGGMCICVTSVTSVTSQTSQTYIKLEVCNESSLLDNHCFMCNRRVTSVRHVPKSVTDTTKV